MAKKKEVINHPSHYGGDTVYEVIKVIEAWKLDFHLGNAVKYIARAGKKNPKSELEDLEKASWYLNRCIDEVKKLQQRKTWRKAKERKKPAIVPPEISK